MLSIQEVGTQVISHNPGKFYVFCGIEYGIKDKYLNMIEEVYHSKVEAEDVESIFKLMRSRHIIPLKPTLYIIRYDKDFISKLCANTSKDISKMNIIGTIVCIYEDDKQAARCEKYIPEFTVCIDEVGSQYIQKYLSTEFPKLDARLTKLCVDISANYGHARQLARCMSLISEDLSNVADSEIAQTFGHVVSYTDKNIRIGVASRNFRYLCRCLSDYSDNLDQLLYTVLGTLIDLDKLLDSPYSESDIKAYTKLWSREDIYYMFMHTYDRLKDMRTISVINSKDLLVSLFSLVQFREIPSVEVLK